MHQVRRRPRTDLAYKGQSSHLCRSKPGEREDTKAEAGRSLMEEEVGNGVKCFSGDRSDQDLEMYIGSIKCVGGAATGEPREASFSALRK